MLGTSIGGYTLIKLLGTGGMGSVYLANDPTIGQQVAVKIIRTDLEAYADSSTAQKALERFRQEARAVAGLDHLHILPLYRYGEEETPQGLRAYMIMQYRPEGSLWDWLRRRADLAAGLAQPSLAGFPASLPTNWPLRLEEVAEYVRQAASALQYAHDRGIVHRDIKPANFLLRIDAQEKTAAHLLLSDFGLAKVFTASSATNTILGTPTYMAPEQFEGAARPESDQYALGVMAYYLLVGRAPFEGDALQLMRQHLTADVPSTALFNPEVPPHINGILARALAKVPEQRFPSIVAFAEAFAQATKSRWQPQAPLGLPKASGGFNTSDYAAATILGDSPLSVPPRSSNLPPNNPAAQRTPGSLVLPGLPNPISGAYNVPSPAPGAYNVQSPAQGAYNAQQPGPTVYPYPVPSPDPTQSGGISGAQGSFANPAQANIYAPPRLTPDFSSPPMSNPSYPPQQQVNKYPGNQKVSRRGALGWVIGGAAIVVAGGGIGAYFYFNNRQPSNILYTLKGHTDAVTSLSWLADGTRLASGSLDQTVRLWSASDGSALQTLNVGANVHSVAWNPDGSKLAAGEDVHSLTLWRADGSPIKRLSPLSLGVGVRSLVWRNDGQLLFLGTYGSGLHALDIVNDKLYGSNNIGVRINGMSISPDGRYMALALESGIIYLADLFDNWRDIYHYDAHHGAALSIAWSPNGSSLVVGYANNIAVIYSAPSRQVQTTLRHNAPVYSVAWSLAAGGNILASGAGDNTVNIWNLGANQHQTIYSGHNDAVLAVAWSNSILASASKDQTIILWQPPTS